MTTANPTPTEFYRLRTNLKLSIQDVALEMKNSIHFNSLYNFEHGMPISDNTKKQIQKWIDSKKNLVIKKS